MEQLIGRTQERAELMRCYESARSEFVILYGRRRIGKTFLVSHVFGGRFDFYFTGSHKVPKERQFITSYTPSGRKKKGAVYRLTDFYCLLDDLYAPLMTIGK